MDALKSDIAAARRALALCDEGHGNGGMFCDKCEQVRAEIAKAKAVAT
jgi:hypothetical protein